jgi:phosphoribosylformylglycinamidine cyclo-ligase
MSEYEKSGVDIKSGEEFVRNIKKDVASTHNPNVLNSLGAYGGLFSIASLDNGENVLVGSIDGVGTKSKFVKSYGKLDTLGHDIVNHCVNDILCMGARPLFMMDYLGVDKLDHLQHAMIVRGLCDAAKYHNMAIIGGETAEMRTVYQSGEFDIVGSIVGAVSKELIVNGHNIIDGDVILGLPSSGLHTNGYSLVNRLVDESKLSINRNIVRTLCMPHRSYFHSVHYAMRCAKVKGAAHITGGGFDNVLRVIPKGLCVKFKASSWEIPEIFVMIQSVGEVSSSEMFNVFNMGIGMMLVVSPDDLGFFFNRNRFGFDKFFVIGQVHQNEAGNTSDPTWTLEY